MRLNRIGMAASVAVMAFFVASSASAEELKLKSGFFLGNQKSPHVTVVKKFIDEVNATGKGQVQIVSYVGPESVQRNQWCNAVRTGVLDVVFTGPAFCGNLVKMAEGITAQNISFAEQRKIGFYDFMQEMYGRVGIHFLGQFGFGSKFHFFSNKPFATLDEMTKMKFRSSASLRHLYAELGIQGLETPLTEVYTAVDTGVLNGAVLPNSVIESSGLAEIFRYRVEPGVYNPVLMALVNQNRWKGMTQAQRDILTNAAIKMENEFDKEYAAEDKALGDDLLKKGIKVIQLSPEDSKRLIEAADRALWEGMAGAAPEDTKRMRELVR